MSRKDIFEKKPFYYQNYFFGKLYNDEITIENIQIFIEFSEIEPCIILGYIIGNYEKYKELIKLYSSKNLNIKFVSYELEQTNEHLSSDSVSFDSFHSTGQMKVLNPNFVNIICKISFSNITIIQNLKNETQTNYIIRFFLNSDAENLGSNFRIKELHWDGNIKSYDHKKELRLNLDKFNINLFENTFFDSKKNSINMNIMMV